MCPQHIDVLTSNLEIQNLHGTKNLTYLTDSQASGFGANAVFTIPDQTKAQPSFFSASASKNIPTLWSSFPACFFFFCFCFVSCFAHEALNKGQEMTDLWHLQQFQRNALF